MCRARPVPEELKQTTRKKRRHCVMLRRLASVSRLERNVPPCDTLDLRGGRWRELLSKIRKRCESSHVGYLSRIRTANFLQAVLRQGFFLSYVQMYDNNVAFFYKQQINVTVQFLSCEAKRFTQSC